jgi:hypothetical protein
VLEVLEQLKDDESEFVRKSVANNLNDISKDNPELALETAVRWYGYSDRTNRIVKHGLRTLLKKGNTQALRLFGFGDPSTLNVEGFEIDKKSLPIGDVFHFSFQLVNTKKTTQKVRLEYKIDFVKSNGTTSGKIFQIIEKEFHPGPSELKRKHGFHDLTTRKHYPGLHRISIIVNGEKKVEKSFHLTLPAG